MKKLLRAACTHCPCAQICGGPFRLRRIGHAVLQHIEIPAPGIALRPQRDHIGELYEQPQTAYVAQFIGENNQLLGTVESVVDSGLCTVRLKGGPTVKAIAAPDLQSGDSCLLSIRPERVSVGATASDENQLHGIIEGSIYLGDHLRLLLRTGELLIIAKVPNKNAMRLGIQEDTLFGWSAVDCRPLRSRQGFQRRHGRGTGLQHLWPKIPAGFRQRPSPTGSTRRLSSPQDGSPWHGLE
jgi:hypothetical protein